MSRYLYRSNEKQIVMLDTLEIIELDAQGSLIFEDLQEGYEESVIARKYSENFNISLEEAMEHITYFTNELQDFNLFCDEDFVKDDMALHTPIVHIIQNCNSPCTMCDCWKTKGRKWFSSSQLDKLFVELKSKGAVGIMVSGGEPLMHPELDSILGSIKENNLEIYLNTNGILLNKKIDVLKKHNIEEVVLSMDGTNRVSYARVRGTDQFDRVIENIKLVRNELPDTRIVLRTTLTKEILFNLKDLISLARKIGVDHIGFSPLDVQSESFSRFDMEKSRVNDIQSSLLPSYEEISKFLLTMSGLELDRLLNEGYISWGEEKFKKCLDFYISLWEQNNAIYDNSLCTFPFNSLVVDYDGGIKSCFYSSSFGHIDDVGNIEWDFKKREKQILDTNKCRTCRGKIFCGI